MAQHDYDIANQSGSSFRSDLNNCLDAIQSQNSGSAEPSTTVAFMPWADTNASLIKFRNAANDGFITLCATDGTFPAKTFTGDVTLNAQSDLRFADSDSSNWVAFQAPATVSSNVTWTLPSADATTSGQALVSDGSGTLSWAAGGGDISDTAPERTFTNTTEEDTDGGRESKITFKGEQSGGEVSTLAQIEASHDGSSDDEKGQIVFRTNDGSDGSSPTDRVTIDSSGNTQMNGRVAITRSVDTSAAFVITNASSVNQHIFFGSGTVSLTSGKVQIDTSGNIDLRASGGNLFFDSGKGVSFADTSDAAGMSNELLDDYEEGTFTPTWSNGVGSPGYSAQSGRYTKIGNVVYFQITLTANAGSVSATHLQMGGLPYTAASSSPPYGGAYVVYTTLVDDINSSDGHVFYCLIVNGTTNIYFYKRNGAFWNSNDGTGTVVNKEVRLNGFYTV